MAGTQVLPSWLTLSTSVLTNAAGSPTYTYSTTLELPLTYYGPSVPLGSDGIWTWGGLTSPAPTSTITSSSPSATPTTTSAPLSTSSTSPSSALPSSTSPSTTASSSSTSTVYPYNAHSVLSKGAIVGIIVGGIFFAILLLTLLICYARWRNRRQHPGYHNTPIWTGWEYVHPRDPEQGIYDPRPPAPSPPQGSPRSSGEEVDPFLMRSVNPNGAQADEKSSRNDSQPNSNGNSNSGTGNSNNSNQTASSGVTDYGVILNPGRIHGGDMPPRDQRDVPARPSSEFDKHIISPSELLKLSEEDDIASRPPRMYGVPNAPLPEHLTPLLPPPPIDPDRASSRKASNRSMPTVAPLRLREKSGSRDWDEKKSAHTVSFPNSDLEESKVSTARRVRVQDLGSHSAVDEHGAGASAGPSSWRLSISSISSLGTRGMRWLTGSNGSRPSSRQDRSAGSRRGLTAEGERPMSTISTRSGGTVYHDAHSRLGTPVSMPSRAATPSGPLGPYGGDHLEVPPLPMNPPPPPYNRDAVDDEAEDGVGDLGRRRAGGGGGGDLLDMPPPMQSSVFAASRGGLLPPGLPDMPNPVAWRNSAAWTTESGHGSSSPGDAGITIDILDADPPAARDGWRSLAIASGGMPSERRATFGTVINPPDYQTSEQGSLHSMRSHSQLSPTYSPPASGSAPTAWHRQHSSSNSSRPSARSHLRSPSSKGSELSHTHYSQPSWSQSGSGSSYARRQMNSSSSNSHHNRAISPSVSALGGSTLGLHNVGEESEEYDPRVSTLGPMPSFGLSTIRSVGPSMTAPSTNSDDTEVTGTGTVNQDSGSETEALHFPDVPRFGGLTVRIP